MKLLAVELVDFRNLSRALVELHPRFNVFSGDNAQGKTNLLEAVYLLGTLQSFRASRLEEMVRFGAVGARARARLERRGLERLYEVEIAAPQAGQAARKLARIDGKAVRATAEHFGGFNVVLFAADDLQLPRGAPDDRRRFLDRAVWNGEPAMWRAAQTYRRVLKTRNAVLRDPPAPARLGELLDVYDAQLARAGAWIVARRRRYLAALAPRAAAAFERITRSGIALSAAYESPLAAEDAGLEAELGAALAGSRERDLQRGHTGPGPHGDDLALALDGRPARLYASQGQLRTLVLALKVAEIELLEAALGDRPILLLDDVSAELDGERNAYLFAFVKELECQVLITTTDPAHVLLPGDRRDYSVVSGAVVGPVKSE